MYVCKPAICLLLILSLSLQIYILILLISDKKLSGSNLSPQNTENSALVETTPNISDFLVL